MVVSIDGWVTLRLTASEVGLREVEFMAADEWHAGGHPADQRVRPTLVETERQLRAYFAGELKQFHLPLDMQGTPFQLRVWNELLRIPFGETRSYAQMAQAIGKDKAVRAVGAANGANPVPIVVPCHRVIGSGGKLVGFGGGLPLKRRLLELEGVLPARLACAMD